MKPNSQLSSKNKRSSNHLKKKLKTSALGPNSSHQSNQETQVLTTLGLLRELRQIRVACFFGYFAPAMAVQRSGEEGRGDDVQARGSERY
jgi:hypothetical protein